MYENKDFSTDSELVHIFDSPSYRYEDLKSSQRDKVLLYMSNLVFKYYLIYYASSFLIPDIFYG